MVAKLGNMFQAQTLCTGGKNVFDFRQIHCIRAAKFVSATYVSPAAKLGNVCLRNSVSLVQPGLNPLMPNRDL